MILVTSKKHCANNGFSKSGGNRALYVALAASVSTICRTRAQVAELVDAYVSGAYVARRAGSSPVLGT